MSLISLRCPVENIHSLDPSIGCLYVTCMYVCSVRTFVLLFIRSFVCSKSFRPSIRSSVIPSFRPSIRSSACRSFLSFIRPSFRLSVRSFVRPSVRPSVYLSDLPSILPSVRPSLCPAVRPSVFPSVRVSVHPFVILYIWHFINTSTIRPTFLLTCHSLILMPACMFVHFAVPSSFYQSVPSSFYQSVCLSVSSVSFPLPVRSLVRFVLVIPSTSPFACPFPSFHFYVRSVALLNIGFVYFFVRVLASTCKSFRLLYSASASGISTCVLTFVFLDRYVFVCLSVFLYRWMEVFHYTIIAGR